MTCKEFDTIMRSPRGPSTMSEFSAIQNHATSCRHCRKLIEKAAEAVKGPLATIAYLAGIGIAEHLKEQRKIDKEL